MSAPLSVPDFSALRVAVAGDLIADRYLYAEPTRLSREAPVLVLRHRAEELRPGGAANAAANLLALGARTRVLGIVGADEPGRALLGQLHARGALVDTVQLVAGWATPSKTRVLAADPRRTLQQVLRIDREPEGLPATATRTRMAQELAAQEGQLDALLLSDYEYGAVGGELAEAALALARAGTQVVLDPRRSFGLFRGIHAMTPNLEELALECRLEPRELDTETGLARAALGVLERHQPRALLVTLGNRGMALFGAGLPQEGLWVEASGPEEVLDVSGAGDTAAALFTLGLAAGCGAAEAMFLANAASGIVVMRPGTATCSAAELQAVLARAPRPRAGKQATSR